MKLKVNAKLKKKVKANWRKELDDMVMVGTGGESVCEERGKVDLEPIEELGIRLWRRCRWT